MRTILALTLAMGLATPALAHDIDHPHCGGKETTCRVDFDSAETARFASVLAGQAARAAAVLCAADLDEFNTLVESTIEIMTTNGQTQYTICRVRKSGRVKCGPKVVIPSDQLPEETK